MFAKPEHTALPLSITLIQALRDYLGVQVGINFNLINTDDIVLLSSNNKKLQTLLEAGNHHASAVGMRYHLLD